MKPGLIYQIKWDTTPVDTPGISVTAKVITVNIFDTETLIADDADENIIPLKAAMSPLTISVVDNNEDKFTPVRAKQAVIRFLSDTLQGQDASTFFDSSANRWKVIVSCDAGTIFAGYIIAPDTQQDFLPDPVTVELTATDRLASLKDIALTDFDGLALQGKYKIGELIAMCLQKTMLGLSIKVVNNVRHGSGTRVADATFTVTDNQFITSSSRFFYKGMQLQITGTASNNMTTTVTDVGQGIITIVRVSDPVTNEGPVSANFADLSSNGHFYDKIYLDAKTFEKNVGESEDCRMVLEKILGEDCALFQWKGYWYIIRIDEIDDNLLYEFSFDPEGVVGADTVLNPTRGVGANASICHAQLGTTLRTDIRHKFIKETFKYVTPKEIVCNMDFVRGSATVPPDLNAGDSTGDYILECWFLRKTAGSITSNAFIRRKFTFGTEIERYIVVTPQSGGATPYDYIESQPMEFLKNDKGSVSVSFRFENNISGSGNYTYFLMKIYLVGDDGNYYYWWSTTDLDDPNTYRWTSSAVPTDRAIAKTWNLGDVNETEWQSLSVEFGPLPIDGKLFIGLYQGKQGGHSSDNQNIYYQGLSLTYTPFINGSYRIFTGQYNKVTRSSPTDDIATRDKEVFISDSPRKEFKGAMFFLDSNGVYRLTTGFYASNVTALGPPASMDSVHSFGHLQAYSVWNQYRLANRIFPSSMYGIFRGELPEEWPDLINKYQLTDTNPNTNSRYFLLVSFEQDWKTCLWRGTFIQSYNQVLGKSYSDTKEFNYISEG